MTPARIRWAAATVLLIGAGCAVLPDPEPDSRENVVDYAHGVRAESLQLARNPDTTYVRRMRDLIRRSRLVPTDSVARLFVAVEAAPDSMKEPYRQMLSCKMALLMHEHGLAATMRALDRMHDSLRIAGFRSDAGRFNGGEAVTTLSPTTCGGLAVWQLPRLPDSLAREPRPTSSQPR
jgi:hypothetical protein